MDVTCRVLHCSTNELVVVGAVVAREYGLPCVVNVSNATVLFSTGCQFYDVIHYLMHNLNGTGCTNKKQSNGENYISAVAADFVY